VRFPRHGGCLEHSPLRDDFHPDGVMVEAARNFKPRFFCLIDGVFSAGAEARRELKADDGARLLIGRLFA